MDDKKFAEIVAKLKAFKAEQARMKAEKTASECPGPLEGVVEGVLEPSTLVLYCRMPNSGCKYIGEQVNILGANKTKYLCRKK